MTCLLWWVLLIAAVWALAFFRAPAIFWTGAFAVALALLPISSPPPVAVRYAVWIAFVLIALPFNIRILRRICISGPILGIFRKVMPRMSQTEQEALDAGTVWWDGELFSGQPDWEKLLATPVPRLSAEELAFLDGPVEELCRMLDDWKINEELHDLPPEVWRFLKDKGFFGMIIPKNHGGLEFSALAHSTVVMKVASRSISAAVTIMVPNSLGPGELLLHYGTEAQKDYYLPRLARGVDVPCFGLTSLEAGSDAASMTDTGVVCRGSFDGKPDVLGIRLNWSKRYITLGPVATVLGLAFKLYDPDHLLGENGALGITVALVPTNLPGISIGERHAPASINFMNGPNSGKDVFIPVDFIIGGAARAGQGWRMLMESLAAGRSISLPALSAGATKLASRAVGAYARVRRQFKIPIAQFEGIEEALARIGGHTYTVDAARMMTAGAVDQGEKPSVVSAIIKYHLTERMRLAVNDAMDVQGGSAICLGPRNFLGRVYQAIPISITVEGANILTRSMIIFGQGAVRCHPYVLAELNAANDPDPASGARAFDRALFSHIALSVQNAARSLLFGLIGSGTIRVPADGTARPYYQKLSRMSAAFALASDVSMLILGGQLKFREKISARLGDILSNLYLASAALKRYEDQGRPKEDEPLLQWSCETALFSIQQSLDELFRNFPLRPVAWILRLMIFPLGKPFRGPDDALGHAISRILVEPSPARDRLTHGIYLPTDPAEPMGRLDLALGKVISVEDVEAKLRKAVRSGSLGTGEEAALEEAVRLGLITEDEAARVREAESLRHEVLTVDAFPPDYWKK
jgi:acyl-CoA dehydrogenase